MKRSLSKAIVKTLGFSSSLSKKYLKHISPVEIQYLGTNFELNPADNFTEYWTWTRGNPPENFAIEMLAHKFANQSVSIVDVGGNAGLFSLPIMASASDDSALVLFEPNPIMVERLSRNIQLNNFRKVSIRRHAIADEKGRLPLRIPKNGNLGQGQIGQSQDAADASGVHVVDIDTLENSLAAVSTIDLLKVDVEGLEDRVIVPFLENQQNVRPKYIYFEIAHKHHWRYPLLEVLATHGYSIEHEFGADTLFALND